MKIILKQIEDIQNKLFLEWNPDVLNDVINLIEKFVETLPEMSLVEQNSCLLSLSKLEKAILNKDYLLVADILEFELKLIVKSKEI